MSFIDFIYRCFSAKYTIILQVIKNQSYQFALKRKILHFILHIHSVKSTCKTIKLFILREINYISFLSSDMKIYDCNDGLSALINIWYL